MKQYLLALVATLCSVSFISTAQAQTAGSLNASAIGAIGNRTVLPAMRPLESSSSKHSPASAETDISYFDANVAPRMWVAPFSITGAGIVSLGERITLPAASGFLDSVTIVLDTITADSVSVEIMHDTLYTTGAGDFHLINIFDQTIVDYADGWIYASQVHGRTAVTLTFPHVEVPQNFEVVISPNFDDQTFQFTNAYGLAADTEAVRPRTTDNTHSVFAALLSSGGSYSGIFDSTFLSPDGGAAFANFYITAHVQLSNSSVATQNGPANTLSIFPNPAASELNLNLPAGMEASSFEIRDLLGRVVLREQDPNLHTIDVSHLGPGRYEAILTTPNGIETEPIIVQR
ncbi:MAG TPA: T9SS type A sorting domain-containing protein [Candidatus Kapabacteria bacterium]|jgi:hypothetical protein|nr:T9SS type A sorting domain-containing protein [Candidatus Kapabacteria bacterium]